MAFLWSGAAAADIPVGLHAGYAFRTTPSGFGAEFGGDDRAHGTAASVVVDSPALLWGFGVRGEGLVLAWPGTEKTPEPLGFFGGGAALTYRFDDTAVEAVASVGAVAGAVAEGAASSFAFGPSGGLLLRFPLTEAASVDARVVVPFFLFDDRFSGQAGALIGVSIKPDVVVAAALAGRSPLGLLLPAFE